MPFEKGHLPATKLTMAKKKEIFKRIHENKEPVADLAMEYGVAPKTIYAIRRDSRLVKAALEELQRAAEYADYKKALAAARVAELQTRAVEVQEEFLEMRNLPPAQMYLRQNAAVDLLNRGGTKAAEKEDQTITLSFASGGGFTPGMPNAMAIDVEAMDADDK